MGTQRSDEADSMVEKNVGFTNLAVRGEGHSKQTGFEASESGKHYNGAKREAAENENAKEKNYKATATDEQTEDA